MTRRAPGILPAIAVFTACSAILLVTVPSLLGTAGKIALGVPLLLVFPGYVVLQVLLQTSTFRTADGAETRPLTESMSGLVSLAVGIGFSIVLVPIVVRGVMFLFGYSRTNVVVAVAIFTILFATVGSYRSRAISGVERRSLGTMVWRLFGRTRSYFNKDTKFGLLTSIVLVVSVLFFLSTIGFALTGDTASEPNTEFYLLTENESGELVASEYPATVDEARSTVLVAGVNNNEHETITYTMVVEVHGLENGSIESEEEMLRTQRTVEAGDATAIEHSIETGMTGENLRVQYYLYRGEAPSDPSTESAYRTIHLSLDGASET